MTSTPPTQSKKRKLDDETTPDPDWTCKSCKVPHGSRLAINGDIWCHGCVIKRLEFVQDFYLLLFSLRGMKEVLAKLPSEATLAIFEGLWSGFVAKQNIGIEESADIIVKTINKIKDKTNNNA